MIDYCFDDNVVFINFEDQTLKILLHKYCVKCIYVCCLQYPSQGKDNYRPSLLSNPLILVYILFVCMNVCIYM